jgi:hypothetical protein
VRHPQGCLGFSLPICEIDVLDYNSRKTEVLLALKFEIHIFLEGKYDLLLLVLISVF